jgi:hypothetical protein
MTMACRAYVDHAFGKLGLNRIEIRADTENRRSRAVPSGWAFGWRAWCARRSGCTTASWTTPSTVCPPAVAGIHADRWIAPESR